MKNELYKYKNNLNEQFNDNNFENNDILGELDLYKQNLESKIRIQKNKNIKKENISQIKLKKEYIISKILIISKNLQ